ncbi:unnamed protein product [Darwinula stevensoni]|uniref:NADPH-dependent FMN reductase-like domain-containing protein n=1 Tax=Darwinula stevensoni TaxID=69355 RepID=A0A7R8X2X6_9CRUS|nr:unnamed protein product [Darwinula stevensoni]CAG0883874.1 unnamed protein product [Darwinula stevensoni]
MSKSLNAILIMGSTRDGRNCERVSKFVSKIAKELDFNVTVFGMMGGSRAGTLLRPHLSELGMVTVPAYVCANQITNSINPEGECSDDTLKGKMERILQELQWYGRAIKTARSETKPPT